MKMYGRSIYSFIEPREPLIAYTITFLHGWVDVNPDFENGDKPSFSHVTIYTVDLCVLIK